MKKILALVISFVLVFSFFGCDYYEGEAVSFASETPDSNGITEYQASVSTKKNAARITLLRYKLDDIQDGQIGIKLPEKIQTEDKKEYPIDSFGGATGTNAPLQKFSLIVEIESGRAADDSIALTVDAGSLPLDTSCWLDVQICFLSDNTVTAIPVDDIIFLSNEPLSYYLHLKERDVNGETSNATYSDKWYETPDHWQIGGEKVTVKIKRPADNIQRDLYVNNERSEPAAVCNDYIEYELVMPYRDLSITIVDTIKP